MSGRYSEIDAGIFDVIGSDRNACFRSAVYPDAGVSQNPPLGPVNAPESSHEIQLKTISWIELRPINPR
jgi:hypothetical protein